MSCVLSLSLTLTHARTHALITEQLHYMFPLSEKDLFSFSPLCPGGPGLEDWMRPGSPFGPGGPVPAAGPAGPG